MGPLRKKVLFFGSDAASLTALEALAARLGSGAVDVVCPLAKMVGRGKKMKLVPGEVRKFAEEKGIRVFDAPENTSLPKRALGEEGEMKVVEPDAQRWAPEPEVIRDWYEIGVVVSFGHFMPRDIIEAFPLGAINLHPSLLPVYRGAAPIQRSLMNGDTQTGVSIIKVDPIKFDSGDILRQIKIPIEPMDTYLTLSEKLLKQGTLALLDVLENYDQALRNAQPQVWDSDKKLPKAFKIKPETRLLDFTKLTARSIWNRWRGLSENGGVATFFNGKRILLEKILPPVEDVSILSTLLSIPHNELISISPGTILSTKKQMFVACAAGTFIECIELKMEGKASQSTISFINGHHLSNSRSNSFALPTS